jgi:hypothetical protein
VLIALAVFGGLYLGFVVVLLSIGRRGDARAASSRVTTTMSSPPAQASTQSAAEVATTDC